MSIIQIIIAVVGAIILGVGIYFIVRRFSNFPLRVKFLIVLLTVALVPIAILIVINNSSTRSALTSVANTSLSIVAAQSAQQIDSFIQGNTVALEKEADLAVFKDALTIAPEDFIFIQDSVLQAMRVLVERNPDTLKTYALLDREGNYITGHPFLSTKLPPFLDLNPTIVNGMRIALLANLPYVSPVLIDPESGEANIYFAMSINSDEGESLGLLLAVHDASILQTVIEESNSLAGEGSYGMLFDEYDIVLAHGYDPAAIFKSVVPLEEPLVEQLQGAKRLQDLPADQLSVNYPSLEEGLKNSRNEPYFTIAPGPSVERSSQVAVQRLVSRPWVVAYIQPQAIFLGAANQQTQVYILLGVLFVGLTAVASFGAARLIGGPISGLVNIVDQISSGNLEIQAPVTTEDEIGKLASAFNSMTTQLKSLLEGLESQVAERTKELERRALQIQTAAEVARDASQIQDLDNLLDRTVNLINQRFDFYHCGLFLLDNTREYAVLRAANSEGGKKMIARGHRLRVGQVGIVGDTTQTGKPHISLDVAQDRAHYSHEFLPETRSEMALPLVVGDDIIGALDVQSIYAGAFDEEDIAILQVLADQLAIAIQNSQLLSEIQDRVRELQAAYGDYTRRTWSEWSRTTENEGYQLQGSRISAILESPQEVRQAWASQTPIKKSTDSQGVYTVPIQLRGNTLGVIHLKFATPDVPDEITDLVNEISERLALALDNARLFESIQQQAAREQLISGITSRMRETLDVKTVLSTAVQEIRNALELHDIAVQLDIPAQE